MSEGQSWSDIADWYDELLVAGSGPHETALACTLRLLGKLEGKTVLDLACGQGVAARAIAEAGAGEVVGVDSSPQMLANARRHGGPDTLRYVEDDAQQLGQFDDEKFDAVSCQLGLMDIPDLAATLAAVHRVQRPGGPFVFVIGHPCFLAPEAETLTRDDGRVGRWIPNYFDERFWRSTNPRGVRRAGNHHRTIATYLNHLAQAHLVLEHAEEPRASPHLEQQQPEYAAVPIFFAARVRKASLEPSSDGANVSDLSD
jgi:ubiquinone/menaquinone biosynthesis C-methylase UbiE